jgi:hypothetical protein
VKEILIAAGGAVIGALAVMGALYWYFRDAFR